MTTAKTHPHTKNEAPTTTYPFQKPKYKAGIGIQLQIISLELTSFFGLEGAMGTGHGSTTIGNVIYVGHDDAEDVSQLERKKKSLLRCWVLLLVYASQKIEGGKE